MADQTPILNCFWGEPYQDANGEWHCPDAVANQNSPLQTTRIGKQPPLLNPYYAPMNTNTVTNSFSFQSIANILKAHPYLTASAVALILWFFFGDKVKKRFR